MSRQYKQGHSRDQGELFPRHMDDYVHENHPLRALDAYVDSLNLSRLDYRHAQDTGVKSGQPSYAPGALLKLYLYGYLNRIKSSRCLEQECRRNLEVLWLMQGLRPSYKTISDFRSANKKAIRASHKEFILLCNQLSLFSGECIAVDGSFFKGQASQKSYTTTQGLKKSLKKLEQHIKQWQSALERHDQHSESEPSNESDPDLKEKLEQLAKYQAEKATKEQALQELEAAGKTQQSRTDPDARLLNKGSQKVSGYNIQIVTDRQHHLIVADEVTNDPNDLQQLHPMASQAKEVLGVEAIDVLGDAGYYSAAQLVDCLEDGITPYVPIPKHTPKGKNNRYRKERFRYESSTDQYHCPADKALKKSGHPREQNGQKIQRYAASDTDCKRCSQRNDCLNEKSSHREIWRSEHEEILVAHRKRMQTNKDKMRQRSGAVEHPFGTLKNRAGWSHFLLRGKDKVAAEFSLMAWSYNFTRVLNILGVEAFMEAVKNKLLIKVLIGLSESATERLIFWPGITGRKRVFA